MSMDKKKRELLPDIINHQCNVKEKLTRMRTQLDTFDSRWAAPKALLLDGEKEKIEAENLSVVDGIYAEMNRIDIGLEEIIKHLGNILANYLGDA